MKKTLLATLVLSSLALTACGESEKSEVSVAKDSAKQETVETSETAKSEDKVELPMVKTELKKPGNDKSILLKSELLSGAEGSKDKVKTAMLKFKEDGLSFNLLMKDEVDALKGIAKDDYEIKLKDFKAKISVLEAFLSDKHEGTKKQSFYFSNTSVGSEVGFFEVQYDDMSKEDMFIYKSEGKWVVFETKAEKEAREKKLKAFLKAKQAELKKAAEKAPSKK